jgi:hypothetical protein
MIDLFANWDLITKLINYYQKEKLNWFWDWRLKIHTKLIFQILERNISFFYINTIDFLEITYELLEEIFKFFS